jgi:hypothetical protein
MSAMDLTLAEAATLIAYGVQCKRCWVTVRIDLAAMAERLGPTRLVRDIGPRLRCSRCGQREVILCTLWLEQTQTAEMVKRRIPPCG